jgi:hypothetical protein
LSLSSRGDWNGAINPRRGDSSPRVRDLLSSSFFYCSRPLFYFSLGPAFRECTSSLSPLCFSYFFATHPSKDVDTIPLIFFKGFYLAAILASCWTKWWKNTRWNTVWIKKHLPNNSRNREKTFRGRNVRAWRNCICYFHGQRGYPTTKLLYNWFNLAPD